MSKTTRAPGGSPSTPPTRVPGLRDAVRARRYSGRVFAEDPLRRVRVPVDELGLAVLQALGDGPRVVSELVHELGREPGATADTIRGRVALFELHALLETDHALEQEAIAASAPALLAREGLAEAPLRAPGALVHGCVACGSCCMGTDIGPLTDGDLARLEDAGDWRDVLPEGVEGYRTPVRYEGQTITLMARTRDRCVFLDDDKLCLVHKVSGAATKPTICRQFPYTFTRTPDGVDVSFSMECRAWHRARAVGRPVAEQEDALRVFLREGGPVLDLPSPVPAGPGADWPVDRWLQARAEAIEAVTGAADMRSLVLGLVEPFRERAREDEARREAARAPWLDAARWGLAEGTPRPGPGAASGAPLPASREALRRGLEQGLQELAEEYDARGDGVNAARVRGVLEALVATMSRRAGAVLAEIVSHPQALSLRRDAVLASLYAHEPARQGDLRTGVALLVARTLAGRRAAQAVARRSLRVRTEEQDVVDSVVLLTKMLRGTVVHGLLSRTLADPLRASFFWHVEASVDGGVGPRRP